MKKSIIPLLSVLFLASCGTESMTDMQPNQEINENILLSKEVIENGFAVREETTASTSVIKNGARWQVTDQYLLFGTMADGLMTGFVLKEGVPVILTASGEVGFYFAGLSDPATPNGRPELGSINGFPIVSLVARVGGGELQLIGTGPTQVTGSGELILYVNDSFFGDNSGAWNVEVIYDCYPGNGFGDPNHYHCK
ncbi:hypothetical protein SYJ56_02655 [Algoriphagus sp. D3-2-R+10]|uniref:hypothetical protein n=1 Tax=Algoriphagus aurantiacus TaxID=3103948 RepID=UPI002B3BB599|nr:hypothetical protein [Algoriphagus sp. D3-2-R+10]MEB2774187.1 hypothetical protein [Algoriphagus sp. D3-2-R+10]